MNAASKTNRWQKIKRHTGTLLLILIFGIIGMATQYGITKLSNRLDSVAAAVVPVVWTATGLE